MSRISHALTRLGVLVSAVAGLVLVAANQVTAMIPPPGTGGPGGFQEKPLSAPERSVFDRSDWTLQWVLLAVALAAGLTIVGIVTEVRLRRRWRQPPLEAALAASDSDDLPRAAGLLGDLLARHRHAAAAEHAYRAAIDIGDQYWSPVAQVALADLLTDRGERTEAQTLLQEVIASGHPCAGPAAQDRLGKLLAGGSYTVTSPPLEAYETLDATAHEDRAVGRRVTEL